MATKYVFFTPDEVLSAPDVFVIDATFTEDEIKSEEQRVFSLRVAAESLALALDIMESSPTYGTAREDAENVAYVLAEFIGQNASRKG